MNNNINFKGYSNVIGHSVRIADSNTSFIAMQLNNLGKADLDAFKSLQDIGRKIGKRISGDIIQINSFEAPNYGYMFEINEEKITPGFYLKSENNKTPKFLQEEAFTMRAFTLIASLMERLRFDTALSKDKDFSSVIQFSFENLSKIFSPKCVLDQFLSPSFFRRDMSDIAEKYLKSINSDMMDYFS